MARGPGKGVSGNPNGRPKGTPNKSTSMAREAIARFVDGNADRLVGWLDEIAADSPKDAFSCFMSVVEYHIPKLQRTEGDIRHDINATVEHVGLPEVMARINSDLQRGGTKDAPPASGAD